MVILAALINLANAAYAASSGTKISSGPYPRPIAEFEPVKSVLVSDDYFQGGYDALNLTRAILDAGAELMIASTDGRSDALTRLATAGLRPEQQQRIKVQTLPHGNLWMRDYGPVFIRTANGPEALDLIWGGQQKDSENLPVTLAGILRIAHRPLSTEMDGGNFLSDGTICVTSRDERVPINPNREAFSAIGCEQLLVLDNPPHPHIDMWLKIVGPKKALVSELNSSARAALRRYYGGHIPEEQLHLGERLDVMAQALAPYFSVERIPIPVMYRGSFRTYTNSLLVNGKAIVPRYKSYGWGYDQYPDSPEQRDYEKVVEERYAAYGFSVTFVDADGLIFNGGALHCIALQIPE